MNSQLVDQLGVRLGENGLPYIFPIHPNLVHLTLGLFIIAIAFDLAGAFFALEKPLLKLVGIPISRANLFDVGWFNLLACAFITFFTVATGFFEIMLAQPPTDVKSAWGLGAYPTMLWHGVGGVFLLTIIVLMTLWRGLQRYRWHKDKSLQVQWSYLLVGILTVALMYVHGTLGAHLAAEFTIHVTAADWLQRGPDTGILK